MHRLITSVLGVGMLISPLAVPVHAMSYANTYDDAIEYLKENDIAEGYIDGSFRAEQSMNRAELTKIIMLATAESDDMRGSNCFRDVQNQWFAMYVCAARQHGMVSGYQDGMFHPERPVSLAEASSLVARAYDHSIIGQGQDWYMPYMEMLQEHDALPPTAHMVHAPLTRGEMAYMIWKMQGDDDEDSENSEDSEDSDEEDLEISIDVPNHDEIGPGDKVVYEITIENKGEDDIEGLDVHAELDGNAEITDADDWKDDEDDSADIDNLDIEEDEEETIRLVITIDSNAEEEDAITLTIEAGEEEEDFVFEIATTKKNDTDISVVGDPILHWNAIALQAEADDKTAIYGKADMPGPTAAAMALAEVHAAMYDAVNSIDKMYQPYIAYAPIAPGEKVSVDAAVATAASRILLEMFPLQKNYFAGQLQNHLSLIPDGEEKNAGIRVGNVVAENMMNVRKNDGSKVSIPPVFSNEVGQHRPDPVNPDQGLLGATWGNVKTFGIASGSQFRADPPPALTSKEYADAFNEVKLYGGDGTTTPTARSKEQTEIGLYWAYDGTKKMGTPVRMYNQITRVIAKQKHNTTIENARLFALVNISLADAGIGCWDSKYTYNVWRPIVGIREADAGTGPSGAGDNNPLTTGDTNWTPLGAPMTNMTMNNFTPPFPAYPSGHATFGSALFSTIENFYGTDAIPFTFISDELNGVTLDNVGNVRALSPRSFTTLSQAAKENAQSRIYLGVHWQFDATSGLKMGDQIADYNFAHILQPLK